MKFTIKNEKAEYLGYFKDYNAVAWTDNSKMYKYSDECFEFSLKQVVHAFYLKFTGNSNYQCKLVIKFA